MPVPVNRSCSTATAESTWRTPSPPAASGPGAPAYRIGDNRYIDGGYRRNENADLAAGYGRVLVLSPFGGRSRHPLEWGMQLAAQVDELRASGSRRRDDLPGWQFTQRVRRQHDGSVDAPARRPGRLRPGQGPGRAAHRILALLARPELTAFTRLVRSGRLAGRGG